MTTRTHSIAIRAGTAVHRTPDERPGSAGEHALQCAYGSGERADRFYADQVRDRLLPAMREFVERMEMVVVATADGAGECAQGEIDPDVAVGHGVRS